MEKLPEEYWQVIDLDLLDATPEVVAEAARIAELQRGASAPPIERA
jgi:hypothetical protein